MRIYVFIIFIIAFTSCNNENISSPSDDNINQPNYTIIKKLNQTELDSLKLILDKKLDNTYLAQIDSFGLLDYYHGGIWKPRGSDIKDSMQAISLAKSAIVNLSQFTNVSDTSDLISIRAIINDATKDWEIIFGNQIYKGMEVMNTRIDAIVANEFVCLYGQHHYKNIFISQQDVISKERIIQKLVGTEITYQCNSPSKYLITSSSINLDLIKKCIYPLLKNDSIELRVVWKVPIMYNSVLTGWNYYIDIYTGEVIALEQLFYC